MVTTGALLVEKMMARAGALVKSDAPIPAGAGGRSNAALAPAALASTWLHKRRIKPRIAPTLSFSLSCGYELGRLCPLLCVTELYTILTWGKTFSATFRPYSLLSFIVTVQSRQYGDRADPAKNFIN